jgi:hypothetical protein
MAPKRSRVLWPGPRPADPRVDSSTTSFPEASTYTGDCSKKGMQFSQDKRGRFPGSRYDKSGPGCSSGYRSMSSATSLPGATMWADSKARQNLGTLMMTQGPWCQCNCAQKAMAVLQEAAMYQRTKQDIRKEVCLQKPTIPTITYNPSLQSRQSPMTRFSIDDPITFGAPVGTHPDSRRQLSGSNGKLNSKLQTWLQQQTKLNSKP